MAYLCHLKYCLIYILVFYIFEPIEGLVRGQWGAWNSCSATCNGNQQRERSCEASVNETCAGETSQQRLCSSNFCLTTPIIICIVLSLLIILAAILLILLIRRKIKEERAEKNKFNITDAPELYYDQSIHRGSRSGSTYANYQATTSSVASSRATLPTIAPYLPDVEEESYHHYEGSSTLGSTLEASMDFEVDNEFLTENTQHSTAAKVTTMTSAETQTDNEPLGDDESLEVHIEVV